MRDESMMIQSGVDFDSEMLRTKVRVDCDNLMWLLSNYLFIRLILESWLGAYPQVCFVLVCCTCHFCAMPSPSRSQSTPLSDHESMPTLNDSTSAADLLKVRINHCRVSTHWLLCFLDRPQIRTWEEQHRSRIENPPSQAWRRYQQ